MSGDILAIDPGTFQSAYAVFRGGEVASFAKVLNAELLELICERALPWAHTVVCEQIESYGMAVGAEVFATVEWSGRFHQAAVDNPHVERWVYLPRRAVKLELCGSSRANDGNIRQSLADLYGGVKACKGTKRAPGPLYGISGDMWSALAVGITYLRTF